MNRRKNNEINWMVCTGIIKYHSLDEIQPDIWSGIGITTEKLLGTDTSLFNNENVQYLLEHFRRDTLLGKPLLVAPPMNAWPLPKDTTDSAWP